MKLRTVLTMAMGCLVTLFSGAGKADGLESPAVKVGGTAYASLEAAIAAAQPVDGVIQYEVSGKVEVTATGWVQVLKSGLSDVTKVAFVGVTDDAEICITGGLAILADQQYDIDVSFKNLKLSKPKPEYGGDYGHSTKYFTTWLRNTGAAGNTVTYENCTFPNGACNNQYGKTVYTNCSFENATTGLYNLWVYGGAVEMNGGAFTGTRGMKVYTEGAPETVPSVEVKDTTFDGLTEKAAIVVSKAATVALEGVSATDCTKGLIQKDIEGSTDDQKVTIAANGSKISGTFAITAEKTAESAKAEFNITGGSFTAEVSADYCADGFEVKATTDADGNTVYGVVEAATAAAKIGDAAYETLGAALADVAERKPLTWVSEGAWPTETPVYYNGKFYKSATVGYVSKGALDWAIEAANEANAADVAKIYVRPGYATENGLVVNSHQNIKTSIAVFGNDASLGYPGWEPCVEYPGVNYHTLTKDISIEIYNLHDGAAIWGQRLTGYTLDVTMADCKNVHELMVNGQYASAAASVNNYTIRRCTFDGSKGAAVCPVTTTSAGKVVVEDCTFANLNDNYVVNMNNKNGGKTEVVVKSCSFTNCGATGKEAVRLTGEAEGSEIAATLDGLTFDETSAANAIIVGNKKSESNNASVSYTITKTAGTMNVYKQGATAAETTELDAETPYTGDNAGMITNEKSLRKAFYEAPTDGTTVTITLGADITLETLYAAENFGTEKLADNAEGDTFNRYKIGVHPTEEDPTHWNPLVTDQTQEQRVVYGAYYNTGKTDERIARLVVKAGQKIVLDLNGHTIQKNARATHGDWSEVCTDIIGNYGTLEIVDTSTGTKGTIKGIGYFSCKGAVLHNYEGATMTVTGVNVDGNAAGMEKGTGQYVISNDGGTLTIDGANVFDTAATVDASLVVSTAGTVTITGNAILNHPTKKAVNVKGGVVNIDSATIISDEYAIYAKDGTVNVSDLTITGTGTLAMEGNAATITKKPGVELPAPEGFTWVESDGVQVLKSAVAQVGDTKYATFADAIAAAKASDTVTLLADTEVSDQITIEKAVMLDLGGKTVTSTYANGGYALVTRAEVTMKNGTFAAGSKARAITAYADLTLEDATITSEMPGGNCCVAFSAADCTYTVKNAKIVGAYAVANFANNATISITDSTLEGSGCGLYHNGSNYGLRLTVTDTIINGAIDQSISEGKDPSGVYLSGSLAAIANEANQNGVGGRHQVAFTRCTIKGNTGIEVKYTDLTLEDCTVEATTKSPTYSQNNNGMTALGFAVVATDNATGATTPKPAGTITIKGENGKYTGLVGLGSLESVKSEFADFADADYSVSGGIFSSEILPEYCAAGFIPTENEDGTYGVKEGSYVAAIGETKYESLAEAIAAAKSGATVQLVADTKENVTIAKTLTLDLNGFTLNGGTEKGKAALLVSNVSVTVKDSSEAQTGTIKREDTAENSGVTSHYVIDIQGKNGFLKFEGGNVTNDSGIGGSKGASLIRLGDDSVSAWPVLTINGGTFTQDNFVVIKVDRGTLHLQGGTVNSANSYAIENWNNANIKGGTVNGTVASWVYSRGAAFSKLEISGGTVNGNVFSVNYGNAEDKQARVYVTGGTVTGTLGTYTYNNDLVPTEETSKATIEVTGGTFAKDPTKYVTEDAVATKNENGSFGVARVYLAQIGENFYYTMDEAFHAAKAGETIVLLRNYTTDAVQNSGSTDITFDLNGNTWTYTGTDPDCAAFEINYSDVTQTVKNGKVVSNSMLGLIPSAMSGTITYDNSGLVFEKVEATANGHSGIETSGNNTDDVVTLKNSTLNVPNGYGIYFASSGKMTIENSTINAKTMGVQVCSGSLNISEGSAITVTGDAVEKTENDGAIEDGTAVSIVNRPGYKGLSSVEISGGTFTAKSGNQALKAYTWQDKTESAFDNAAGTIAVSGGTFSTAIDAAYCAPGFIPAKNADGTYGVQSRDGTEARPYSREQFAAMTRAEYIAAQERLGGTMYVDVGDYSYETAGVLGNGVRDDETGQIPDHSKINAYGENGYLGEKNDGANGKTVVFVGSSITSGVTGYESIDGITGVTSLLLAVPAYTTVKFEGIEFNNVFSFNYQLYTAPWSQLQRIEFTDCTFHGLIVGELASQELAFTGCTFTDYRNTVSANDSNPTWIRPAYGNWQKGDNTTQGSDFRSLTSITFENNKVTSTRPVKFERIAQWEMATTVTAAGNTFDIKPQEGDEKPKNVGMYLGAKAKFDLVAGENTKGSETAALFTTVYDAKNLDGNKYNELPAGSTVKDLEGKEIEITDARVWKTETEAVLKTMPVVATVSCSAYKMAFSTFEQAYASAATAPKTTSEATITLAADAETTVAMAVADGKSLTLSLNGCNLSVASIVNAGTLAIDSNDTGLLTVADGIANTGALTIENALVEASVTSSGDLTVTDADISSKEGYGVTVTGGTAVLDVMSSTGAGALDVQGGTVNVHSSYFESNAADKYPIKASAGTLTVVGETFVASDENAAFLYCDGSAVVSLVDGKFTGDIVVADGATKPVITGGRYRKNLNEYCAAGYTMKEEDGWFGVVISVNSLTPAEGSRIVDTEGEADNIIASGVGLTAAVDSALTDDAAKKSYKDLFTISKKQTEDGKWLVSCTMTAAANALLTTQVDNPAMLQAIVNAVVKGGRATLTGATPGLYYSVVFGTEPTKIDQEVARFLATSDGTVVMPVPKPDDAADATKTSTKGFYRLRVSVGPKAE